MTAHTPGAQRRREQIEITLFAKSDGPLTKCISLDAAGKPISDGSTCVMSSGAASRIRLSDICAVHRHHFNIRNA
jgi:hypothetical protein